MEDRVGASLLAVERDPDIDVGESTSSRNESAVEAQNRAASYGEIQDHLLLDRDLPADAIGAGAGDRCLLGRIGERPAYMLDFVVGELGIHARLAKLERALHGLRDDGTDAGSVATVVERARGFERIEFGFGLSGCAGGRNERETCKGECDDGFHGSPPFRQTDPPRAYEYVILRQRETSAIKRSSVENRRSLGPWSVVPFGP